MNTTTDRSTPPQETLHALIDGQLPPTAAAQLQAQLAQDAEAQARVAAWRSQRLQLRALHRGVLEEPPPADMVAAARRAARAHHRLFGHWRLSGIAASLLVAFAIGWLGATLRHPTTTPGSPLLADAPDRMHDLVQAAAVAHAVYTPEVRHPVEVGAAEQRHLVAWLSKRLGRPLAVPDLSAQGFALLGGRLLPGAQGTRAQFMFEDGAGTRVTLYLGALDAPVPAGAQPAGTGAVPTQLTAFHFAPSGAVPRFYWVDRGFGYALAGALPRERLLSLAEATWQQLGAAR